MFAGASDVKVNSWVSGLRLLPVPSIAGLEEKKEFPQVKLAWTIRGWSFFLLLEHGMWSSS